MQEFAEQFVAEIQPQEGRFDTRLGDDFFVCTFPNSVKTWIYVYEVNGYKRRRTLGVYPDMSLADARDALYAARKLQQVEDSLMEQGLTGEVVRKPEAGAAAVTVKKKKARAAAAAMPMWRDPRTVAGLVGGCVLSIALVVGIRFLPPSFDSSMLPVVGVRTLAGSADAPAADDQSAHAESSSAAAQSIAAEKLEKKRPLAVPTEAEQALMRVQHTLQGTIARVLLTHGIEDEEPIDEIELKVNLGDAEDARVFFFTEVRGMAGQLVHHRWLHEDRLIAEVPLRVGEGWRWPLYSSANIGTERTGNWEVVLLNADGRTIARRLFIAESDSADRAPATSSQSIAAAN